MGELLFSFFELEHYSIIFIYSFSFDIMMIDDQISQLFGNNNYRFAEKGYKSNRIKRYTNVT